MQKENRKPPVHLITGFLGVGKTTVLKSLMEQKNPDEKWIVLVNEFGEIGIDGAVLGDNGIPVAEISGGCLCCVAGAQMASVLQKLLRDNRPDRIMIEASGLAHAAGVIDELRSPPLNKLVTIGTVFTVVDPRRFTDPETAGQMLYRDQVSVADVLVACKTDLCNEQTLQDFQERANQLFPSKSRIVQAENGSADIAWLDIPFAEKQRYRLHTGDKPDNPYRACGFVFDADDDFDGEKLTRFFDTLPQITEGLVRAKGVFKVLGTRVWLNWVDGSWGAGQTAWRRDSRFELIARGFDEDRIEAALRNTME